MQKKILGKVNGLFPIPGAFFIYKDERYKVLKAEIVKNQGNIGEVLTTIWKLPVEIINL